MSRSQQEVEMYLALQASRRVHEACVCRLEAAYLNGSPNEIEMCTSALLDSSQTIADRLRDLIFAQIFRDGINPVTRQPL